MKTCSACKTEKPYSEFFRSRRNHDGYAYMCKECKRTRYGAQKREYGRKKYWEDPEKSRSERKESYHRDIEHSRARKKATRQRNKEKIAKYFKRYNKTERGREVARRAIEKYRESNPEKCKAHSAVSVAIRSGLLVAPISCPRCGSKKRIQAHHWSYKEQHWLDIEWMCEQCHNDEHVRLRDNA